MLAGKTVLITGAAKRIGAQIARTLHQNGANLIIHYRNSKAEAQNLVSELNSHRPDSSICYQADLSETSEILSLAEKSIRVFGQLDILINNASSFYPTPLATISDQNWDELINSNAKAPLFLSQACQTALKKTNGCIINLLDIYATSPLKNHSVYCSAKAANQMLVKSLALDMAPDIRVNGVALGAILWPEANTNEQKNQLILDKIPLQRIGNPDNITQSVLFLINNNYITGEVITIDGGRLLAS